MYATYDFRDNKLRLYPSYHLSDEERDRLHKVGFIWAPAQQLFVAPAWSPDREDLLLEMCDGVIEVEEVTPLERAGERAERFEGYAENAQSRADTAHNRAREISDGIPLGQPILVGHHSEGRARRDADRIWRATGQAVTESKKAEWWMERAKGALAAAERKERPDVIYRRIETLEAELRGYQRDLNKSQKQKSDDWAPFAHRAHPDLPDDQVQVAAERRKAGTLVRLQRWIEHLEARIAFERALYEASGGIASDKKPLEVGGAILYWDGLREILKVNKKSVTVPTDYSWTNTVPFDKIRKIYSREEYQAALQKAKSTD